MKYLLFLSIAFSLILPAKSFGQAPITIQHVRLGNVKKSVTHFGNKHPYSDAKTTYDYILANPRMVCDEPGYEVSRYTLTFIPRGKDLVGPYHITGAALTERDKTWLKNRKEERSNTRIAIEDIFLKHNGREDSLIGTLLYQCN